MAARFQRTPSRSYLGFGDPLLHGDSSCPKGSAPTACRPTIMAAATRNGAGRADRRRGSALSGNLDDLFARGTGPDEIRRQIDALCPLPDTSFEIKCVALGFGTAGTELHLGADATEATLKALNRSVRLPSTALSISNPLVAGDLEITAKRQGEPALVLDAAANLEGSGR